MSTQESVEQVWTIRPANINDLETACEFFNHYSLATIGVKDCTLDSLRQEWTTPGYDLETSTRAIQLPNGDWIGYAEVWDLAEVPVHAFVWGCVHPKYQRRGIGTHLQLWAEDRARRILTRLPEDLRASIRLFATNTNASAIALFKKRGASFIRRYWDMQIDLSAPTAEPQWPVGLRIITFDVLDDFEAVYHAIDEAFKDHWGYVEESFEAAFPRWKHRMTTPDSYDPKLWFLAMDGDQIAGLSICKESSNEDPDTGWVRVLGVRRPWRKRGLGTALLLHSFAELRQRGKNRAGLGVDSSNLTGATGLYEKVGMHVHRIYDSYEIEIRPGKELSITSIAD
ncbi:MAG: GNAT family N-acetyltransferase [Anaerolineales bacterium]